MNVPGLLLSCGLSFVFLCLVFRPLEMAFPARSGQRFFRPAWLPDLDFFAGQYLLWNGVIFWLLGNAGVWLQSAAPLGFPASVASQAWWAQAIEVVFLSDLCVYWGHRLQHRVGWLWRFHSIHHSAEHLDWLAAHRGWGSLQPPGPRAWRCAATLSCQSFLRSRAGGEEFSLRNKSTKLVARHLSDSGPWACQLPSRWDCPATRKDAPSRYQS
jgi:hypothetical protein